MAATKTFQIDPSLDPQPTTILCSKPDGSIFNITSAADKDGIIRPADNVEADILSKHRHIVPAKAKSSKTAVKATEPSTTDSGSEE